MATNFYELATNLGAKRLVCKYFNLCKGYSDGKIKKKKKQICVKRNVHWKQPQNSFFAKTKRLTIKLLSLIVWRGSVPWLQGGWPMDPLHKYDTLQLQLQLIKHHPFGQKGALIFQASQKEFPYKIGNSCFGVDLMMHLCQGQYNYHRIQQQSLGSTPYPKNPPHISHAHSCGWHIYKSDTSCPEHFLIEYPRRLMVVLH